MNTKQKVIAIVNKKGGVGKTTTALALAAGLRRKKQRVLLIDFDSQENASFTMQANMDGLTIMDVLTGKATAEQAIQHTEQGDIIAASEALDSADLFKGESAKHNKLAQALQDLRSLYDYIIIDTPPALGILTINALTAATDIIVTSQADIYSLQGIRKLYETIRATRHYSNPSLVISGILLTRHNPRTVLGRDLAEASAKMAKQLDTYIFKHPIRECVAIREAQITRKDIFSYAPRSNAAADYAAFVNEFIKR